MERKMKLRIVMLLASALLALSPANAEEVLNATMFKQPYCSCCDGHAEHLRTNNFRVTVVETDQLAKIKARHGVPPEFEGCHTLEIGGYVVEGHVPASVIRKLLKERPKIRGISLPGMPDGSPGMGGTKREPFVVYEIGPSGGRVFAMD
jgi:hypothetical protein